MFSMSLCEEFKRAKYWLEAKLRVTCSFHYIIKIYYCQFVHFVWDTGQYNAATYRWVNVYHSEYISIY